MCIRDSKNAVNSLSNQQNCVPKSNGDAKLDSGILNATLSKLSWNVIRLKKA